MKWKKIKLINEVKVGEDELGNAIFDEAEVMSTMAMYTPWTDEQVALEGRSVTKNEQRYAIPVNYVRFPDCTILEIDEKKLEITQKIKLQPRYTVVQVKQYKE